MSTGILKALPGKQDIKRHSPRILYTPAYLYLQRLLTRGAKLRQIPVCPLLYCTRRTLFKLDYFEDFGVDRTDLILTLTKDYDLSRLGMQQKLKQMEMNHLIKDQR